MREVKSAPSILVLLLSLAMLVGWTVRQGISQTNRPIPRSSTLSPSDTTFRRAATAGEPLIFTLPDTLAGRADVRYQVYRAPALSWLVDGSFFWRPRPTSVGPHTLQFLAQYPGQLPADTVTVMIKVRSPN